MLVQKEIKGEKKVDNYSRYIFCLCSAYAITKSLSWFLWLKLVVHVL